MECEQSTTIMACYMGTELGRNFYFQTFHEYVQISTDRVNCQWCVMSAFRVWTV